MALRYVRAKAAGFYGGARRRAGDRFYVPSTLKASWLEDVPDPAVAAREAAEAQAAADAAKEEAAASQKAADAAAAVAAEGKEAGSGKRKGRDDSDLA